MAKSVYSLVLSDAVIEAIDREAYRSGVSRSQMIDRVLAEYVGLVTPERRIRRVFGQIEDMLTGTGSFQLTMQPTASTMSLRSALNYKYNPTIRYSIERRTTGLNEEIWLKIQLRTSNQTLINYMHYFFRYWQELEERKGTRWNMAPARYERKLKLPEIEDRELYFGEQIADYIRSIDESLNLYFKEITTTNIMDEVVPRSALKAVLQHYAQTAGKLDL
ncbi:MAG: ribbon-helix-helix protein, CopG family [Lachnospiraceae bacterium]|nr:ribbon-helix-helix protein, CopG family [Lachnospiraceae bacterium]